MSKQYLTTSFIPNCHQADIFGIAPTKAGLVSISGDGNVKLWRYRSINDNDDIIDNKAGNNENVMDGKIIGGLAFSNNSTDPVRADSIGIHHISISQDEELMVTCSFAGTLRFYQLSYTPNKNLENGQTDYLLTSKEIHVDPESDLAKQSDTWAIAIGPYLEPEDDSKNNSKIAETNKENNTTSKKYCIATTTVSGMVNVYQTPLFNKIASWKTISNNKPLQADSLIGNDSQSTNNNDNQNSRDRSSISTIGFGLCIDYSPTGDYVAVGSEKGDVFLYSVLSKRLIHVLMAQANKPVRVVRFSPKGLLLAAAGDNGIISVYDMSTGNSSYLKNNSDSKNTQNKATTQNDYSSSENKSNSIPNADQVASISDFGRGSSWIFALDFNTSGEYLLGASFHGKVKIFSIASNFECIATQTDVNDASIFDAKWIPLSNNLTDYKLQGFATCGTDKGISQYRSAGI